MPEIRLNPTGDIELDLQGHWVTIPETLEGLRLLRHILIHRQAGKARIGEEGAPTQWLIDKWLREDKARKQAEFEKRLADLGLDDIDLGDLL